MPEDRLTQEEFEQAVREALESIPKRFADMIRNVAVEIEDEPDDEVMREFRPAGGRRTHELLGLYQGVPLTLRGSSAPALPDRITIYRGPISRVARSHDDVVQQVRDTVIHEVGHYFGLSDEEMPHSGKLYRLSRKRITEAPPERSPFQIVTAYAIGIFVLGITLFCVYLNLAAEFQMKR